MIDRTVEPLGDDTIPPCIDWLDKFTEEKGYQSDCHECRMFYQERDVNFQICRVLDGEEETAVICPMIPAEICEKCSAECEKSGVNR